MRARRQPMVAMATVDGVRLPIRSIRFERGHLVLGAIVKGPSPARARRSAVVVIHDKDRKLLAKWVQPVEWDAVEKGCNTTVVLETRLNGGDA